MTLIAKTNIHRINVSDGDINPLYKCGYVYTYVKKLDVRHFEDFSEV